MGNFKNSFKRFITNKNTVTILGVLVGIVVLFIGYNYRITTATTPVYIPVAKTDILERTKITQDMITTIRMPKAEADKLDNLYKNTSQIVNKYVNYNTTIPKNGMFFTSNVVEESAIPNSIHATLPDGYSTFALEVSSVSVLDITYGNSIMPGDYVDIDLYAILSGGSNAGKIYNGRLIKSIEVLSVTDRNGKNVFASSEPKKAEVYVFAVDEETLSIFRSVIFANSQNARMSLVPTPRNRQYTEARGEPVLGSRELLDYIKQFTSETTY